MLARVVVATQCKQLGRRLRDLLGAADCHVEMLRMPTADAAWSRLLRRSGDLFLVDRDLLPDPPGEAVQLLGSLPDSPDLIVAYSEGDYGEGAALVAAGASAVIDSAMADELIHDTCFSVIARRSERVTGVPEIGDRPRLADFETQSARMRAFLSVVFKVVNSDSTLLITGETGVGKEHLARAIHAESHRSAGPFVPVNCGALPEALLESELFGHEEGAFTGASRERRGMFELAHNGTIFLDEIGEMPVHLQVKMLQVLQTREVRRVGGDHPVNIDVRVIAATNRDLLEEIEAKRFRLDLYYRLSVVSLEIPPLRERSQDVDSLVSQFIRRFRRRFATSVDGVDADALNALRRYRWPGNIRELANIVERAMLLAPRKVVGLADLPHSISGVGIDVGSTAAEAMKLPPSADSTWTDRTLAEVRHEVVADFERDYLDRMLRRTEGRIGETAERSGIQPRSLYEKMKRYDLHKEDYRYRGRKRS